MAASTTPNLHLPQWTEGEDLEGHIRSDFNAAFLAIDGKTLIKFPATPFTDCNDLVLAGVYRGEAGSLTTHTPPMFSIIYGHILVLNAGLDTISQIAIPYSSSRMAIRSVSTADNIWTPWVEMGRVGILSVVLDGPATFDGGGGILTFTTKLAEAGVLVGNASTDSFTTLVAGSVQISVSLEITHSTIEDQFHIIMYDNGANVGNISSFRTPANSILTAVFTGIVLLDVGHTYKIAIRCNGGSGPHTPMFSYSKNLMNITFLG